MFAIRQGPSEMPQPPEEIAKRTMTKHGRKVDVATGTTIAEKKKSLDVKETSMRRTIPVAGKMTVDAKKGWPLGERNASVHETNPARIILWKPRPTDDGLPRMIATDDINAQQLVRGSLDISGMKVRRRRTVRIGSERRKKNPLGWTPTFQPNLRSVFLVDKYLVESSMASRRGRRDSKIKK